MKHKGFIAWQGISPVDGSPLAGIVTLKTANVKTGDMPQLWIIRTDINPVMARKDKLDASNCGTCPLKSGGGCYVNVGQAPLAVFKAFHAGSYPVLSDNEIEACLKGKKIRLGAYGDPAMLPFEVCAKLAGYCVGHTGYTHQWKNKFCDKRYSTLLQASCDNKRMQIIASATGWKTFRHAESTIDLCDNETRCLSDSVGMKCVDCMGCNGATNNFVVIRHGAMKNRIKT